MVDDSLPQWIRTYPEEAAPRTGDGLFPGEVIEVAQVKRTRPTSPTIRYQLALALHTQDCVKCSTFLQ